MLAQRTHGNRDGENNNTSSLRMIIIINFMPIELKMVLLEKLCKILLGWRNYVRAVEIELV